MSADTGGPAFPHEFKYGDGTAGRAEGMTLRDYFAAKSMQGLLANSGGPIQASSRMGWGVVNCTIPDIAQTAYEFADAMLEARAK